MGAAKILIIIIGISLMLRLGGIQLLDNDILDRFVSFDDDQNPTNIQLSNEFMGTVPINVSTSTGNLNAEGSGFSFFDALGIVWGFILFMFNILLAPIALLSATGMPGFITALIGVPLMILYIYWIIVFVRGGGG